MPGKPSAGRVKFARLYARGERDPAKLERKSGLGKSTVRALLRECGEPPLPTGRKPKAKP